MRCGWRTELGSIFSNLYESDSKVTLLQTVSLDISTLSETSTTANPVSYTTRPRVIAPDMMPTVFPFRLNLHENFLRTHNLHNFANIGPGLLQKPQLLPQ